MIGLDLARRLQERLRATGNPWQPEAGDRFYIPDRDLDDLFVVSEMTIEVAELPTGPLIRFNGTTEWALDSIEAGEVVWLPWEHQLRRLLGTRFRRLEALPGPAEGFAVVLEDGSRHLDTEPDRAYVQALLAAL